MIMTRRCNNKHVRTVRKCIYLDLGKNTVKSKCESTRLKENWHYLTLTVPLSFQKWRMPMALQKVHAAWEQALFLDIKMSKCLADYLSYQRNVPAGGCGSIWGRRVHSRWSWGKKVVFGNSDCLQSSKIIACSWSSVAAHLTGLGTSVWVSLITLKCSLL